MLLKLLLRATECWLTIVASQEAQYIIEAKAILVLCPEMVKMRQRLVIWSPICRRYKEYMTAELQQNNFFTINGCKGGSA